MGDSLGRDDHVAEQKGLILVIGGFELLQGSEDYLLHFNNTSLDTILSFDSKVQSFQIGDRLYIIDEKNILKTHPYPSQEGNSENVKTPTPVFRRGLG